MNVEKKKDKFLKRLKKANDGETVKVVDFERKHFKKTLSTSNGFGVQDMKEGPKEFYKWLLIEDYNITVLPTNIRNTNDFGMSVTVTK